MPRSVTFVSQLFAGASWLSVFLLWGCALSVYLPPRWLPGIGLVGLSFPLLLGGTLFLLFLTLLFAPRRSWIALLGLVACAGTIRSYCPLNPWTAELRPTDDSLRLVSYNTQGFGGAVAPPRQEFFRRLPMLEADLLCYQEGMAADAWVDSLRHHLSATRLRHCARDTTSASGLGIASAFPIVRQESITRFGCNGIAAFWVCRAPGDTLLVVNCHLRSNTLDMTDRDQYRELVHQPAVETIGAEETFSLFRRVGRKIAASSDVRAEMIDTLEDFLARQPACPTIICGDFNETPVSYCPRRVAGWGYRDAFRTAGNGIGRSFNRDAIWVRIDHAFVSDHFDVVRARVIPVYGVSDHNPLSITLRRRKVHS